MPNCECKIVKSGYPNFDAVIVFCPMHQAAGDMLKALKTLLKDIEETGYTRVRHISAAIEAIAKAEEG